MSTQAIEETGAAEYAHEVGVTIKTLMWRRGVKGQQIADALGIGASTVSGKLKGRVAITTTDLMTIARVLEVDPGELLPRLDSNQQPSGYRFSLVEVRTEVPAAAYRVVDLDAYRAGRAA